MLHFSAGHSWVPMWSKTKPGIPPLLKVWRVLLKKNKGKVDEGQLKKDSGKIRIKRYDKIMRALHCPFPQGIEGTRHL